MKDLLDLLCVYNSEDPEPDQFPDELYFNREVGQDNTRKIRKTWQYVSISRLYLISRLCLVSSPSYLMFLSHFYLTSLSHVYVSVSRLYLTHIYRVYVTSLSKVSISYFCLTSLSHVSV